MKLSTLGFFLSSFASVTTTAHPTQVHNAEYEIDETQATRNLRAKYDPKSVVIKEGVIGMCDGYSGIMVINSGSSGAAAGTSFFQFVINQLIYAEQHNLVPWVHFTLRNGEVYDTDVHDFVPKGSDGKPVSFPTMGGAKIPTVLGTGDMKCHKDWPYPEAPDYENSDFIEGRFQLKTSGVWDFYFEPVSNFLPQTMTQVDEASCFTRPLVDISRPQQLLNNGVHFCAPWAIRGWIYNESPIALRPPQGVYRATYDHMGTHRKRAHEIVTKFIHPKQWLVDAVNHVNPTKPGEPPCLAMHIRHTDKASGRKKTPLEAFLPYAQKFVDEGGQAIYLATDSMINVERINEEWPSEVSSRVVRQEDAFLSTTSEAIFHLISHHRANKEALIDIYGMSRCGLLVMGYSAMTESAMYINGDLHAHSVNLDDPEHQSLDEFDAMVKSSFKK